MSAFAEAIGLFAAVANGSFPRILWKNNVLRAQKVAD